MYTIHASTIRMAVKGLEAYFETKEFGSKESELRKLREFFQVAELELDLDKRYEIDDMKNGFEGLADYFNEPNLGLMSGIHADLNLLPFHLIISRRLRNVFEESSYLSIDLSLLLISRYFRIGSEAFVIKYQRDGQLLTVDVCPQENLELTYHQIEIAMAIIYRFILALIRVNPSSVSLQHEMPGLDSKDYEIAFGVTPSFNQEHNRLVFESPIIGEERHGGRQVDIVPVIAIGEAALQSQFPEESFEKRCREILREILSFGEPTRKVVAAIFNMSVSTLQRRLKEEGCSFKSILKSERMELSVEYLKAGQLSCNEIAFVLGYQDPAQFYKTFKSHYGLSPMKYRETA